MAIIPQRKLPEGQQDKAGKADEMENEQEMNESERDESGNEELESLDGYWDDK